MTAPANYPAFAQALGKRAFIHDAWLEGEPRFAPEPLALSLATYAALAGAAERVTAVLDQLVRIVAAEPALLDSFFALTPVQRLIFEASFPHWHGHARADVFLRADGAPVVCEVNCDTPSGQPEAVALNQLAMERAPDGLTDPCQDLPAALVALVQALGRRVQGAPARPRVGIVYPTELTEDLALVTLLRGACEARGHSVVLGSPFNLHPTAEGGVGLFGQPVDVFLRHYKTDWWGERLPVFRDEAPYPDPAPLAGPLELLLTAAARGRVAVVNPFGAVLPQNKRAFAFLWEERARFSPDAQAIIAAHVPYTLRLETADSAELRRDRAGWVLKSDYGCEGEEVLMGIDLDDAEWAEAIELAVPGRWIAQRRFDPARDSAGRCANHGVFLVAGRAAGVYSRLSVGATDRMALSVPTLVSLP